MAPKIVDKEIKRFELARAAGKLFGDQGFEKVTMDQVAKLAGVAKGTLYEYFENKESLIHGAFNALMENMMTGFETSAPTSPHSPTALAELTTGFISQLDHFGDQYRFFLEYMLFIDRHHVRSPSIEKALTQFRKGVETIITQGQKQGQFKPDLNIADTAAAFVAWIDGAIFHVMILKSPTLKQMVAAYIEMAINGLIQEKQRP